MISEEYVQAVAQRLEMKAFDVRLGSLPADFSLAGFRSQVRLRWLAKVNLFVLVAEADVATADTLEVSTRHSLDYGIAQKGRFRGLQNGVAVVSVVVANTAEPGAIAFAKSHLQRRAAAFAWPVLVDLSSGTRYRHEGRVVIGGFFANWMRDQIDDVLPELPSNTALT